MITTDIPTRLAVGSLVVALSVLTLKIVAWQMTGSVALYSDAMESFVNVAGALVAWLAIRFAARPPDASHPFGHHKAENFSAIAEGVLIVVAALLILQQAVGALRMPEPLALGPVGLSINAIAAILNLIWSRVLIRAGARHRSPALDANGRHLMSDVWTSVGVLGGLGLAALTGWAWLDPFMAMLVAVVILHEGWKVIEASAGDLMDSAAHSGDREVIERAVRASSSGALQIHDLRTRRAGKAVFVEFHLVVPREMTVGAAHVICDRIEDAIEKEIAEAHTTIHVEPDFHIEQNGMKPD